MEKIQENTELKHVEKSGSESPQDDDVGSKLLKSDEDAAAAAEVFDEGDWEDFIPEPPDGGWGWVIVIASFFNNFILDGIAYCFGVFLMEYAYYFKSSVAVTSLSNALLCGVYLLIGPIAGAFVNKFGCRITGVAGSIIAAVAFILSTFSPSVYIFHFTYGIIGGFGLGLMYLPAVVGCGYYFEKKRAIATGIAVCGTGIGTFALAPFAKFLLFHLDWKNTHYVFAGLLLHGCIFASLMRPLTGRRRKPAVLLNKSEENGHGFLSAEDFMKHRNKNMTKSSEMLRPPTSKHTPRLHSSVLIKSPQRNASDMIEDLSRPMYRKDIFFSGSVLNIPRPIDAESKGNENGAGRAPSHTESHHRVSCLRRLPKPMADILGEMADPHVLKHPGMIVFSFANLFGMMGFYVPIIFTVDRAVSFGVPENKAALLLSIMGICNTVGRVISGAVSVIPQVSPLLLNNICVTLAGLSIMLTPFCTTFTPMAVAIASYGLFASTFISLAPVVIVRLVGLEKLTNGFGLICMVRGITAIIGPPLEGMLYDVTGNYDATFYMGGACILLSAGLHFLLHLKCLQIGNPKEKKSS